MNGNYNVGDVVLGKWTLEKELGAGSYGRVYRAVHEDFGQVYESAIKIITVSVGRSELVEAMNEGQSRQKVIDYYKNVVSDLAKEFVIMSKLKGSSNIVGYEDHEVVPFTDGIGWDIIIRMELLTPLSDKLNRDGAGIGDVCQVGIDICRALELCRSNGVIHRDIKTENIMVNASGDYKLGDFGVARTMDRTTSGMSMKGTYTYMAPEVYREEAYDHRADIYSLGLVLYRLLNNNRAPFLPPFPRDIRPDDRETALSRRFRGEALPAPANATPELAAIILRACAFRPNDRFAEPKDMRLALEAAQRGEILPAYGQRLASDTVRPAEPQPVPERRPADTRVIPAEKIPDSPQLMYEKAVSAMDAAQSPAALKAALRLLEPLRGYKDVDERILICQQRAGELEAAAGKGKKTAAMAALFASAAALFLALVLLITKLIVPAVSDKKDSSEPAASPAEVSEAAEPSAAPAATPESIPEPTPESTPAPTPESTPVPTPEFTPEPTPEPTPESTPAPTPKPVAGANVGDIISFGSYEQDNNPSNGAEAIEWIVLDKTDDRLLVISRYALASHSYDDSGNYATWEFCSLRTWLNGAFLNVAFTAGEQAMIPALTIPSESPGDYPGSGFRPGSATTDKVFLLGEKEVLKYFPSEEARRCEVTAYVRAHGAEYRDGAWWWLRAPVRYLSVYGQPGVYDYFAQSVYNDGSFMETKRDLILTVRPAMWISID